ncbi:leukotriene C4 synthase isoform X2 [Columba livia]|uniref:Leukotriene C4 synthase n=1 Tax=Columba livia TaxID=8932 RepID=A0A2I0M9X5_COLLI|nr:leukotriene C4 synthase isoform X2 [Columba livia]PKK26480.1 leukotriene C4 synthase, transcript variant X1 [Columba livia]PKK26481.1 leukotriene C4 synthase, transcript variant X2 [Columba livia]PKK26482.1 leukotriene C4 synthase, transcript variant X3 [Columba livia]
MLDQIHLLAAVTVLGVLEQAYFFLQVIYARRRFGISPPKTSGPPEFERIFRAQVNCSEYFPIFLALLWQAGLFFHQGLAAALGLLYLYARYCYFMGYRASSSESPAPAQTAELLRRYLTPTAPVVPSAPYLLAPSRLMKKQHSKTRRILGKLDT